MQDFCGNRLAILQALPGASETLTKILQFGIVQN
jgi:hypothetical protein